MSDRLSDLELDAWQALLHAHHKIVNTLDAELRTEHELTFGDYDVLLRLARAQDRRLRMSELAKRVMISPSGLTRAVDRLVDAGLVSRQRDDKDARVIFANLTEPGRDAVKRAARTHLRGVRQHFTGKLSEEQLRHIATALQVITGPHEPH
jgi:DNA-binding MarR family transcriptional regulator